MVQNRRVHRQLFQSLETNTLLIGSSGSPVKSDRAQSTLPVKSVRAQSNKDDDFSDPASIVHSVNGSDEGPSDSEPLIALGIDSIHDIYCQTYIRYRCLTQPLITPHNMPYCHYWWALEIDSIHDIYCQTYIRYRSLTYNHSLILLRQYPSLIF